MRRPRGRPRHPDVLTPAEWRVAEWVRHGLTNPEIARRLGVSGDAVKGHVAAAVGKLGLAGRQGLRMWAGVEAGSAMAAGGGAAVEGLGQVARGVRDVEEAVAFWRDVVGLRHLWTFGEMAFLDLGQGARLFLRQGAPDAAILYLRVGDIHAAAAAMAARGATFRGAPHRIHRHEDGTEEWMAFLDDPEGRPVAIMAQAGGGGGPP